jgi:branched-chain amino acid transport system permease protein
MAVMSRRMRLAALALALLTLSACARIDPDQTRICRQTLAALHPAGTPIGVLAVEQGAGSNAVLIRHETTRAPNPPRERTAECRFGGGALSRNRLELEAVLLDGRALPPANLLFLKRFWIDEPATVGLQPPPSAAELPNALTLPREAAIVLQHAVLALPQIAVYALLAPAFALIYGLIGRINLAFGELAIVGGQGALIGAVAGGALTDGARPGILAGALLFALAASLAHAQAMGRFVLEPLSRAGVQPLLVATAGLSAALMEYVRLSQSDGLRWAPPVLGAPLVIARSESFLVTLTQGAVVFTALASAASAGLLLHMRNSVFGRQWRATAQEPVAAALLGVDTRAVLLRAMALSGLLAGLAGFIITAHYGGIGFSGGLGLGLKALIAAILGGIGSVGGAMAGAVLLGLFEAGWAAVLPLHLREAAVFSLLVLLLVFRPGGLAGHAGRDESRDGGLR